MQTGELLQRIELGIRTQDLLATLDALEGVSSQLEIESIRLARTHAERRGAVQLVAALLRLEERSSSDPDRKASLFFELAQLQQAELLDDEGAKLSLERATALRPGDEAIHEQLAQLRESSTRYAEFAKRYCEHAAQASDANLKATLLTSAARILFKYDRTRRDEAVKLLDEALAIEKGRVIRVDRS